jgi:hypothetical protein
MVGAKRTEPARTVSGDRRMTVGCVHDGVAQYGRGEFLDERRNCVRISLICLLDLSRRRILFDHLVEHVPPGLNRGIPMGRCGLLSLRSRRAVGGLATGSLENSYLHGRSAPVWHESATDNRRLKIGKKFLAYVEQCLAPMLKPKHIVMIDNLPAHKAIGVRVATKRAARHFAICPNIRQRPEPD